MLTRLKDSNYINLALCCWVVALYPLSVPRGNLKARKYLLKKMEIKENSFKLTVD